MGNRGQRLWRLDVKPPGADLAEKDIADRSEQSAADGLWRMPAAMAKSAKSPGFADDNIRQPSRRCVKRHLERRSE